MLLQKERKSILCYHPCQHQHQCQAPDLNVLAKGFSERFFFKLGVMQDLSERNFLNFFQLFCYDAKQNGGIVISRICCK